MMHQLSEDKLMAVSLEVRRSDTKYLLLAEASHGLTTPDPGFYY